MANCQSDPPDANNRAGLLADSESVIQPSVGWKNALKRSRYEINRAPFYSMREKRSSSAGAFHPKHGWVITGGYNGSRHSSCEVTRDGISFEEFLALPIALWQHSIVALDGVEGDFFITGGSDRTGWTGSFFIARTFIFKNQEWREVEKMPTAREGKKPDLQG